MIAGLTATPGPESVALDWDDTASATSYEVFRRNPDGTTYPTSPTAAPSTSQFTDVERTAGTQYCYKVRAVNASGPGPLSSEVCATAQAQPQPQPPGAITGLSATGFPQAVALSWNDTPTATQYYVFRKGALGYPTLPTVTVVPSEFADLGRAAGVRVCYTVRAVNGDGVGPLSGEICATPLSTATPPGGQPQGSVPVLNLSGAPRSVRVDSKGRYSYGFTATPNAAGSLTVTTAKAVTVAAKKKKRKLVLARKSFSVPASGKVKVRVKLGRVALKTLKRAKALRASTAVKLGTLTAKRNITVRAPRKKRR